MFTPASITALIIASSFAAGLNIYATVFTLGILTRTHVVQLPPGLDPLGHLWVLITCGILFSAEFFIDKIPAFDLFWNILHTVVRVPIAALVAYHASSQLTPQMQVIATALGAVIALAAHTSKTAVRAAVTPTPEPFSNIALSTTEDTVAIGLTWFATHHPIIAAVIALTLLSAAIIAARALLRAIQRPLQKIFRPDLGPPT
jgi:ABC-type amino acid transport system permease subunit